MREPFPRVELLTAFALCTPTDSGHGAQALTQEAFEALAAGFILWSSCRARAFAGTPGRVRPAS